MHMMAGASFNQEWGMSTFADIKVPCCLCGKEAIAKLPSNLIRGDISYECTNCGAPNQIGYEKSTNSEGMESETIQYKKFLL